MKVERNPSEIISRTSITAIPARSVQIKKVMSFSDFKLLKEKLPTLKKAILSGDKILVQETHHANYSTAKGF